MGNWVHDAKCAARSLLRRPRFAAAVVIALALGVAPASAIFSIVYAVLLRSLPFPHSGELVTLWERNARRGINEEPVDDNAFPYYQEGTHVFEAMGGFWANTWAFDLRVGDLLEPTAGAGVSPGLFGTLGVKPRLGRSFRPQECRPGGPYFLMLGYDFWKRQFGADPGVVGRALTLLYLNRLRQYTVIGVMPRGFEFPYPMSDVHAQVWTCEEPYPGARPHGGHNTHVVARLKPGITVHQAQADVTGVSEWLARKYPRMRAGVDAFVLPAAAQSEQAVRAPILLLFTATGLVLLIACSNVAALLLARGAGRRKEVAVRVALGAERGRIIRQLLAESAFLGPAGALLAIVLDYWCLPPLTRAVPAGLFVPRLDQARVEPRTLAFAIGVSCLAAALSNLVPAVRLSSSKANEILRDGAAASPTRGRPAMRLGSVMPAEVALAVALLAATGLVLKSLRNLQDEDFGFDPAHLLSVEMAFPNPSLGPPLGVSFGREFLGAVGSLPGVKSVALVDSFPPNDYLFNFAVGSKKPSPGSSWPNTAEFHSVTPGFFSIVGDALLKGRLLLPKDGHGSPMVAVINAQMAARYWPGKDPIGKTIVVVPYYSVPAPQYTIVGVVKEHRRLGSTDEPPPAIYASFFQIPLVVTQGLVQTRVPPDTLMSSIRRALHGTSLDAQVVRTETGEQMFVESIARPAFLAHLLTLFAVLAWLLATVGTYGIVSYTTVERAHEVGIRMALGASRGDILALIVGRAAATAAVGVAFGLGGAVLFGSLLRSLLYGVRPDDPLDLVASASVLFLTALVAAYIPARRASRLNPAALVRRE
jgi:putative ABC transport system permease protein